MKINAPEKIFLHPDIGGREFIRPWLKRRANQDSVEYTRTDAFIEKAKQWLRYNNDLIDGDVADYVESFEKYMKGE